MTTPPKGDIEHPIVILILSYNNKDWYIKNLDSVFAQDYQNYRIIYVDDASKDGTGELVENYVKKCGQEHRTTIIRNTTNQGAMANQYKAIHSCQDHEIIAQLDGDDWFKRNDALQIVNTAYQDKNVWLTYGQFERLKFKKDGKTTFRVKGQCCPVKQKVIDEKSYRESAWVTSALRTFYAGLFKHVKLKDFLCDGKFFDSTYDLGIMCPMLEMTGGKFAFIDKTIYVYNRLNPLNDHNIRLVRQLYLGTFIKSKCKYDALDYPGIPERNISEKAKSDLVIISEDNHEHLDEMLVSVYSHVKSLENIYILCKSFKNTQEQKYLKNIQETFPDINILEYAPQNFKETLEHIILSCPNNHIILANNNIIVKNTLELNTCIKHLEHTYAHGFYFSLGKNITHNHVLTKKQPIPVHTQLYDNIYVWQFQYGQQDWRKPNNLLMTLYRKKDIFNAITNLNYNSIDTLENLWNDWSFDLENIGLFFNKSKVFINDKVPEKKTKKNKKKYPKAWLRNLFGEKHDT